MSEKVVRVAIVEDDESEMKRLCETLDLYGKNHGVKFSRRCFSLAYDFTENYACDYDVIFMDIQLPDLNGISASREIRKTDKNVTIVFVTNFAQYAINGYEVNAADFIVKPVEYDWFEAKMDNILLRLSSVTDVVFVVKTPENSVSVNASQLMYVEVTGHWLVYHTVHGNYTSYGSLNKVEPKLAQAKFVRCNSCYLVNPRFVQAIGADTTTVGGDELKISYSRRKEFKQAMALYLGGNIV